MTTEYHDPIITQRSPKLRCSTCNNFASMQNGDGQCRLDPPQVVFIQGQRQPISYFPYVRADWWCSQHELPSGE